MNQVLGLVFVLLCDVTISVRRASASLIMLSVKQGSP